MISNKNKELAAWAMDIALSNGCQAAKVELYSGTDSTFTIRDTQIDKLKQASENELVITLFVNERYGVFSTNRLDKTELRIAILNAISSTRYLGRDPYRSLPDPSRYYKGDLPDLQLLDPDYGNVSADTKIEIALANAVEAYSKDKRVISVESTFYDRMASTYLITSNGFEGEKNSSRYSLSANVSIRGEGESRPSDYWNESSIYYSDLVKKGVGNEALKRALRKLGQKKIASGKYTMVVDRLVSRRVVSPLIDALYGSRLHQKNSFLLDKLNTRIASSKLTLIDNPHLLNAAGASYFDYEGVATRSIPVFEEGILKTYYIDTYFANRMKAEPTVANPSLLMMQNGEKDLDRIIAGTRRGILVTGFNGGNDNSSTGNFSYGVEGFLIENGRLTQPISEMNITGNMLTLWENLVEVGNDPIVTTNWRIPTLAFDGVDFNGL